MYPQLPQAKASFAEFKIKPKTINRKKRFLFFNVYPLIVVEGMIFKYALPF
jgi:hypothetical protein